MELATGWSPAIFFPHTLELFVSTQYRVLRRVIYLSFWLALVKKKLTSSRRRTSKHAKKLCHRAESILTCIPIFASFVGRLVNTPLVACHSFSESMGSRLGGPGQMALQTMSEFTLFVDLCLIPLSKTCSFDVKDGFISIVTRPFDLCTVCRLFDQVLIDV